MSMEMLRQLAQRPLPATVDTVAGVDQIRVLRAAGFVAALVMKAPDPQGDATHVARVLAVTPAGRRALASPSDTEPQATCHGAARDGAAARERSLEAEAR